MPRPLLPALLALGAALGAAAAAPCALQYDSPARRSYNLTGLAPAAPFTGADGEKYELEVCGGKGSLGCAPGTGVCQLDTYNKALSCGTTASVSFADTEGTPAGLGFLATFTGGDLCTDSVAGEKVPPYPRVTVVNFVCDQTANATTRIVSVGSAPVCTYHMVVTTPLACASSS